MNKEKILIILGVWVAVLPYLGFPYSLKNILFSITGLGIIYLSYLLLNASKTGEKTFENFSENSDFTESVISEKEEIQ
jgi:hypothetical protein